VFFRWASIYAPNVANIGQQDLAEAALFYNAQQALLPYMGPGGEPPDFKTTWAQLLATLAASPPLSWTFDSRTTSPDVASTWTGGLDSGFSGPYTGAYAYAPLSRYFGASHVTVTVQFSRFCLLVMPPGAWYNSSILNMAFSRSGTPPWSPNANPDWDDAFGPTGTLPRFLTSLAIADGATVSVTSDARYSQSAQKEMQSNMANGLWPLFFPSSAVASNTVTFSGSMTMQIAAKIGNPFVVGANVLSVASYLGHG